MWPERIERTLNDTGTLLVVGALAGGVAGGSTAALALIRWSRGLRDLPLEAVVIGSGIGALLGAALFPVALRFVIPRVSLGRAALGTVIGTVAGGTLATMIGGGPIGSVYGGFLGFVLAVLLLHLVSDDEPDSLRHR